jgi:hypothetical protein
MDVTKVTELTSEQCGEISVTVNKLKDFWLDRKWGYTLGAATYQDPPLLYPALSSYTNVVLRECFDDMYTAVSRALSEVRGKEIITMNGTALPGFHIFTPRVNNIKDGDERQHGHPHIDTPYDSVFWPCAISDPFSFTLPVAIPACGAGMGFWDDVTEKEMDLYAQSNQIPEPTIYDYELGSMYLHDGMTPHRIENMGNIRDNELRITLQGHGVTMEDTGQIVAYF